MLEKPDMYSNLPDVALSSYLRNAGDLLADESALLGAISKNILAAGETLNNKVIIAKLLAALEKEDNIVSADIIRKTLEIVVDHTMDDA
ncbi:TPA: biofilm development regulator YmgB/AriR family protein [Citrobacter freundii]